MDFFPINFPLYRTEQIPTFPRDVKLSLLKFHYSIFDIKAPPF